MDEIEKKEYELAVLVKNEEDLAALASLVRQHNVDTAVELRPKRLTLAYEIKKQKEAVFAYGMFRAAPADAKNLEQDLQARGDVLRFMIMKASPVAAMPAIVTDGSAPARRRPRVGYPAPEVKPAAPKALSNEALEKKIEEILK